MSGEFVSIIGQALEWKLTTRTSAVCDAHAVGKKKDDPKCSTHVVAYKPGEQRSGHSTVKKLGKGNSLSGIGGLWLVIGHS